MKLQPRHSAACRCRGVSLIECLVYIAVFGILVGIGTAVFYFCWDHTRAVVFTANEVESTLHAGERWRADVRGATGKITVETMPAGETMRIPIGEKEIDYRRTGDELRREQQPANVSRLLLEKVHTSTFISEPRASVTAWRWELELTPRRKETHFPLLFTFEAAQHQP